MVDVCSLGICVFACTNERVFCVEHCIRTMRTCTLSVCTCVPFCCCWMGCCFFRLFSTLCIFSFYFSPAFVFCLTLFILFFVVVVRFAFLAAPCWCTKPEAPPRFFRPSAIHLGLLISFPFAIFFFFIYMHFSTCVPRCVLYCCCFFLLVLLLLCFVFFFVFNARGPVYVIFSMYKSV